MWCDAGQFLVTYCREYGIEEDRMIEAMYVAAGIGQVIASRGFSGGEHPAAVRRRLALLPVWLRLLSVRFVAAVKSRWDMPVLWHLRI